MAALRIILGDQLSHSISALEDIDPDHDVILMMEVDEEAHYVNHHKQKLVFLLSAMRHFSESLVQKGYRIDYVKLEEAGNTGSFTEEIRRALKRHQVDRIVATEPGEWRVWEMMQSWNECFDLPVDIMEDTRFFCSCEEFAAWAEDRKSLRMEYFYRAMRRKTGWLVEDGKPVGGKWNYDASNRKSLPENVEIPKRRTFTKDEITSEVVDLVERRFKHHFGDLGSFGWGVTRKQARQALRYFITHLLPRFGTYQDAMTSRSDFLFHAALSPYLNTGLLLPREVCEAALDAYEKKEAPLEAVEGFIRQILGWREYIRGIYWLKMPDYEQTNFLEADRSLPSFYWTGETDMQCIREAVRSTREHAYAHHIQRLMITGNFALLAGIKPAEVEAWYLAVYTDAFDWVELPNTHGMVLHADGGLLGSKPYAASGAYINRMSDYCRSCRFDPKEKEGATACPFNYLYWDFLIRNRKKLKDNPRMAMPYRNLSRMSSSRKKSIKKQSDAFLSGLETDAAPVRDGA